MPRKSAKSEALTVVEAEPVVPPVKKPRAPAKPRAKKVSAAADPVSVEPTTAQVAEEAYLLWLSEGQPEGRDVEHWLTAEQIVRSRLSLLSAAVHAA